MPLVKCPNCGKKVNLRDPKPGKKFRCPGCDKGFVPAPVKGGKPKKPRSASSNDFADEDEFDEPAPRRSSKSAGRKGGAGKKKKRSGTSRKSKMPLFLGIGVLGVALAGGLTFMLMSSSADSAATSDESAADTPDAEAGDSVGENESPAAAMADSTEPPAASSAAEDTAVGNINLQWLPEQSEAIVHIDVDRLLSGPAGQLLENPMLALPLQQFRDRAGFGPEDIQSVTAAIGGVSQVAASRKAPTPDSLPFTAVIRTKRAIDAATILAALPDGQSVTEDSLTFIRTLEDPTAAIWFADPTTIVFGPETVVRQVAGSSSSAAAIDAVLLESQSVIHVAISPEDPPAIFQHEKFQAPPQSPPGVKGSVEAIRQHVTGLSIGFDLTQDIGFHVTARCRDAAGATAVASAFQTLNEESKTTGEALANSPQAQMMGPMLDISKKMGETSQVEADGSICRSSATAAGGGQQLVSHVPTLIAQMMMRGFSQQQPTVANNASQTNLQQIAIAMHNFHDAYMRFPNAAAASPTGEKWLSWRVHLLPFLGEQTLYDKFQLEEPWDSPTNRPLADQMPRVFSSPQASDVERGKTLFQVPIGPGSAFEGAKGFGIRDFTDGTSNTILVVEVSPDRAVYWSQPEDFAFIPSSPLDGLGGAIADGFQAAFADGKVKPIPGSTTAESVNGMFTRNGGD